MDALLLFFFQRIRTQLPNFISNFRGGNSKLSPHRRRDIDHPDTFPFQTNLFQNLAHEFDSSAGIYITILVMTVALQSTGHHDAIGAILKRV